MSHKLQPCMPAKEEAPHALPLERARCPFQAPTIISSLATYLEAVTCIRVEGAYDGEQYIIYASAAIYLKITRVIYTYYVYMTRVILRYIAAVGRMVDVG